MKVHMMRGAAPDKFGLWTDGSYELVNHDHTNLVDLDEELLSKFDENNEFVISADEGDIRYANQLAKSHKSIVLPKCGEDVVDYESVVPKNCLTYQKFQGDPIFKYPNFENVTLNEFIGLVGNTPNRLQNKAIKTATGSGSRGIILFSDDQEHLKFGMKYTPNVSLYNPMVVEFIEFAKKEGCNILIQDYIPFIEHGLDKINVDFAIRDSKLIGYKWTKMDQTAIFTNWNFGWHIHNEFTDMVMKYVSYQLIDLGITDALMNFEAFSNHKNETWLVEFNWRYSNSTFEGQAASIDLIGCFLNNREFATPDGEHKFSRYWQCQYYENNQRLTNWN